MYARVNAVGVLAAMLLTLSARPAGRFNLETSGAVELNATGREARYGVIPTEVSGNPVISISLGATSPRGSLTLSVSGSVIPPAGRYPVAGEWKPGEPVGGVFHASFVAGPVERPKGAFRGESGWVRITEKAPSHICGEFEIRARGFLASNPDDENQWVTVRGRFQAEGDHTTFENVSIQ